MSVALRPPLRRIVVAVDASATDRQALALAARLAAVLDADIEVVFVEDEDLLRLADLPFVREVRLSSLAEEVLDRARMEREWRSLARMTERALGELLGSGNLRWTFRTWRGRARYGLLDIAVDADVVTVSRGRTLLGGGERAAPPRPAAQSARKAMVAVPFTGAEASQRALAAACQIAGDDDIGLVVAIVGDAGRGPADDHRERAAAIVAAAGRHARYVEAGDNPLAVIAAITGLCGVVVAAGDPLLEHDGALPLAERLGCPVLVVR